MSLIYIPFLLTIHDNIKHYSACLFRDWRVIMNGGKENPTHDLHSSLKTMPCTIRQSVVHVLVNLETERVNTNVERQQKNTHSLTTLFDSTRNLSCRTSATSSVFSFSIIRVWQASALTPSFSSYLTAHSSVSVISSLTTPVLPIAIS